MIFFLSHIHLSLNRTLHEFNILVFASLLVLTLSFGLIHWPMYLE